jgi:hypothetical protein
MPLATSIPVLGTMVHRSSNFVAIPKRAGVVLRVRGEAASQVREKVPDPQKRARPVPHRKVELPERQPSPRKLVPP